MKHILTALTVAASLFASSASAADPESVLSLRAIAERLNNMNVPKITGKGSWSANSVRRLRANLKIRLSTDII